MRRIKINELERTKERLNRCEKMILQVMERLQALEMDNVKGKAGLKRHVENSEGHKV